MTQPIEIQITDGLAKIAYADAEKRKKTKLITIENLCSALTAGAKVGYGCTIYPPFLRVNAFSGDRILLGFEYPTRLYTQKFRVRNDEYDDDEADEYIEEEVTAMLPNALTCIAFDKTPSGLKCNTFYQYALKGTLVSLDTELYVWPGSNVYQGGNCCMGDVHIPIIESIEKTGGLPGLFYNGVNNNDLDSNRFTEFNDENGRRVRHAHELYSYLERNKKPFPNDILIKQTTFGGFLSSLSFK